MAYNSKNQLKKLQYIVSVYETYKYDDVPDTYIVRVCFPKHNIFISYRQWMNIKNTPLPTSERIEIQPLIKLNHNFQNENIKHI